MRAVGKGAARGEANGTGASQVTHLPADGAPPLMVGTWPKLRTLHHSRHVRTRIETPLGKSPCLGLIQTSSKIISEGLLFTRPGPGRRAPPLPVPRPPMSGDAVVWLLQCWAADLTALVATATVSVKDPLFHSPFPRSPQPLC